MLEHAEVAEHPGSPCALEKGYLSTLKRLGGWSTLEQGPMSILEHLGHSNALEYCDGTESRSRLGCGSGPPLLAISAVPHLLLSGSQRTLIAPTSSTPRDNLRCARVVFKSYRATKKERTREREIPD